MLVPIKSISELSKQPDPNKHFSREGVELQVFAQLIMFLLALSLKTSKSSEVSMKLMWMQSGKLTSYIHRHRESVFHRMMPSLGGK